MLALPGSEICHRAALASSNHVLFKPRHSTGLSNAVCSPALSAKLLHSPPLDVLSLSLTLCGTSFTSINKKTDSVSPWFPFRPKLSHVCASFAGAETSHTSSSQGGRCCTGHLCSSTLYSLLGLSCKVDISEIKIAYRQMARRFHPDVCKMGGLTEEECTRRFIEVQEAYETLSDPARRALYDYEMMNPERVTRGEGLGKRRPWQQRRRPWETQSRWSTPEEQAEAMKSWHSQVDSQLENLKARRTAKPGSWAARMAQAKPKDV